MRLFSINNISIFTLSATLLLGSGCSKSDTDPAADAYYQQYEVYYNNEHNKTEASAIFRKGSASGAEVALTGTNTVLANGEDPFTDFQGDTKYTWLFEGKQDVNFVLDKDGTAISNNVSQNIVGAFDFGPELGTASIVKSEGFTFTWTGTPLSAEETLTATVRQLSTEIKVKQVTGQEITFSSADLATAENTGSLFVTLTRNKKMPLTTKDGSAGGEINVKSTISEYVAFEFR